jgi:hypothetical protein
MGMTGAEALLADLRSRGIELETNGTQLRWRPAILISPKLREVILHHRQELISLIQSGTPLPTCPACKETLDSAKRCPKCFDRLCGRCDRKTIS